MVTEELAINGGKPAKRKPLPLWPVFDEREVQAVTDVIKSRQWWRVTGTEVRQFEKEFAAYHQGRYALAVTTGTQALEVALTAAGIGYGDEVIIPAFTFISTATAVLSAGAVPVLVDAKPDTYCIDPCAVSAAITPRTRAIMPVHIGGHVADMDAIMEIASRHDLFVIEDSAHAPGAEWKGMPAGARPTCGVFSFQASKLLTAGEGGLILSNDEDFIRRCFLFSSCGRPETDRTYQHTVIGTNSRMSELHAAVLRVQLTRLGEQIRHRESNASLLDSMLSEVPGITPQARDPRVTRHPRYAYYFRYDEAAFGGLSREEFVDALNAEGFPAFIAYPAIHRTPVFRSRAFGPRWRPCDPLLPDYNQVQCPAAEEIGEHSIWLHHRVLLGGEEDISELVAGINKIQHHAQRTLACWGI